MNKYYAHFLIILYFSLQAQLFAQSGWFWQNPLPQGNNLYDLHMFKTNTLVLVGDAGTIMKSTNGGTNWDFQTSGTTFHLNYVYFANSTDGWIAGDYGTLLKTTDGGTNWNTLLNPTGNHLYFVHFIDMSTGWAIGNSGIIIKTTNGGVVPINGNNKKITSAGFVLNQNYPNPFNPYTTIEYEISKQTVVKIELYDNLGRKIQTLLNNRQNAGIHSVTIDGIALSSGIYYYQLKTEEFQKSRKCILSRLLNFKILKCSNKQLI